MREIWKLLAVSVLMMLPLTGYTMSYNLGYVEGVEHQQQVNTADMSAFVSESKEDSFSDEISSSRAEFADGGIFGTSESDELAMSESNCMASCHSNPEVGWQGSL